MAKFTADQVRHWDFTRSEDWKPARPPNHIADSILMRLRLAWGVLTGRYDALDWEDCGHG